MCLSVQTSKDEIHLRASYPNANIFYPDLSRIKDLNNQPRYRSAIHSEIVNQSWKMRTDADFAIIMDNDVLFSGSQQLIDIFKFMELRGAVICGTSYPKQNLLSKIMGRQDYKPLNVPNIIFSILDLRFYKNINTICGLADLLLNSENLFFNQNFPKALQGKMIDTAAKIYLAPIAEKKEYILFSCANSFHPYYPGSIKNFLFGGLDSPEIYSLEQVDLIIHHFKKLSSPKFKNSTNRKNAYENWRIRILNLPLRRN